MIYLSDWSSWRPYLVCFKDESFLVFMTFSWCKQFIVDFSNQILIVWHFLKSFQLIFSDFLKVTIPRAWNLWAISSRPLWPSDFIILFHCTSSLLIFAIFKLLRTKLISPRIKFGQFSHGLYEICVGAYFEVIPCLFLRKILQFSCLVTFLWVVSTQAGFSQPLILPLPLRKNNHAFSFLNNLQFIL